MAQAAIIGAGVSILSSLFAGQQQKKTAQINQKIAEREAERQKHLTGIETDRHWRRVQRLISGQGSAAVASGVAVSSSSVEAVERESIKEAVIDAQLIKIGGQQAVDRLMNQARGFERQAQLAPITAGLRAGTSLLASGQQVSGLQVPTQSFGDSDEVFASFSPTIGS